jgi:hypothetical protein
VVVGAVEQALGEAYAPGGHLRQHGGHLSGLCLKNIVGKRLIDHAHSYGIGGGYFFARHHEGGCALHAHEARQEVGAPAIWYEADLAEGLYEGGAFCSQHYVAGQGYIGTGTGSHAIYGGYNGFFYIAYAQNGGIVVLAYQPFKIFGTGVYGLRKILTGTKTFSGTGKIDAPYLIITGTVVQCFLQLHSHLAVETVVFIGPVERNVANAMFFMQQYGTHRIKDKQ